MKSKKKPISLRQIKRMVIIEVFSTASLLLPAIMTRMAGQNGLIPLIAGSIAGLLYAYILVGIDKAAKNDYIGYSVNILGKIGSKIFAGIYYLRFLIRCGFALQLFCRLIIDNLLQGYSIWSIAFPILLICIYLAFSDIEVRARSLEFLFIFIFAPLILVLVLAVPQMDFTNAIPSAVSGKEILRGGYGAFLCFTGAELLLFSLPRVRTEDRKKLKYTVASASGFVIILNIIIFIITVGMFGVTLTQKSLWPALRIMQTVKLPGGFVERLDILLVAFWIFSMFGVLSGYMSYGINYAIRVSSEKFKWVYILIFAGGAYLFASRIGTLEEAFSIFSGYMAFIDFPVAIIAPLFLLALGKVRKKK